MASEQPISAEEVEAEEEEEAAAEEKVAPPAVEVAGEKVGDAPTEGEKVLDNGNEAPAEDKEKTQS